jgi:hypothetical protein
MTSWEPPQLFDADSINTPIAQDQSLLDCAPQFVMVTVDTPSDHEALRKLHRILDGVTGAAEAPHKKRAPANSIRSLFGDVELSWSIKFAGDLESVREKQKQFISDLKELCGAGAVTSKLSKGSIIAHIISPIENYRRVRGHFAEAAATASAAAAAAAEEKGHAKFSVQAAAAGTGRTAALSSGSRGGNVMDWEAFKRTQMGKSVPLQCGGFKVTGVELGDWIVVDTKAWSQLDEAKTWQLKAKFEEHGLGHFLKVLLNIHYYGSTKDERGRWINSVK